MIEKENINAAIGLTSFGRFLLFGTIFYILVSCADRKDLIDQKLYEGPISSMDSINTFMSDSGIIVMHMRAAHQSDYENGDTEWPNGFLLEYFDKWGKPESTFSANYVFYTKKEDLYRAEGNVIVENLSNNDKLNTEELFWDPAKEEFYTDRFVTIRSDDEVHSGEGLKADQDFATYLILKPSGSFLLEESTNSKSSDKKLIQ